MKFIETEFDGVWLIKAEQHWDLRGGFARGFCAREFEEHNLPTKIVQTNWAYDHREGTWRGLHYQVAPHKEAKLIVPVNRIHDIIIDLRPKSDTYMEWGSFVLTGRTMLYVPEGFAHGHQAMEDNVRIFYHMFNYYNPEHKRGIRHDDSAFRMWLPLEITAMSLQDKHWPNYEA